MSEKKLYALTDSEASELRQIMDQAQSQALTDQDGVTYEDLTYLMVPLNTPLDWDAANAAGYARWHADARALRAQLHTHDDHEQWLKKQEKP